MDKSIYSEQWKLLSATLRKERLRAGLTQQELANLLEKPQSFVAKYEAGQRRLDVVELIGIARAIKADPAKILRLLMAA